MNWFHRCFCRSGLWKRGLERELLPWALDGIELGDDVLEVGPGPGLTSDLLRRRFARLTSIEIDPVAAESLRRRMNGTNVTVIEGDATAMPFPQSSFSGAVSFTTLHHVPSAALQNRLFAEVYRVLRPDAYFVGTDSLWSRGMQLIHFGDTLVAVDPSTLQGRLEASGFSEVTVEIKKRVFRFAARHP